MAVGVQVDEFYERFGGAKFALQSEVARAYGDRKIDIYFNLLMTFNLFF